MSLSAPPVVYTPPSAGSPPSAPGAVHAVPAASPSVPGAVHAVPVVGGGVAATGSITFAGIPTAGEAITVNDVACVALAIDSVGPLSLGEFRIGGESGFKTPAENTALNLAAAINLHPAIFLVSATRTGAIVSLAATTPGVSGNSISLTESATNVTVTGSGFLTGGSGSSALPTPPAIHAPPAASPGTPPAVTP